jgi:hypothetical protein
VKEVEKNSGEDLRTIPRYQRTVNSVVAGDVSDASLPAEAVQLIENLEILRHRMAATVLEVRERYQDLDPADEQGQRLLSAAISDLEEIDSRLDDLRRTIR